MSKKISIKVRGRETCSQLAGALVVAGFQVSASSNEHYSGAKKALVDKDVFTIWFSCDVDVDVPKILTSAQVIDCCGEAGAGDGVELLFSYGPEQDRLLGEEGHFFCGAALLNPTQTHKLVASLNPRQSSEIHVFAKKK